MTIETIQHHVSDGNGYCLRCEEVTVFTGISPNDYGQRCPRCGKLQVIGLEDFAAVADKDDMWFSDFPTLDFVP